MIDLVNDVGTLYSTGHASQEGINQKKWRFQLKSSYEYQNQTPSIT